MMIIKIILLIIITINDNIINDDIDYNNKNYTNDDNNDYNKNNIINNDDDIFNVLRFLIIIGFIFNFEK